MNAIVTKIALAATPDPSAPRWYVVRSNNRKEQLARMSLRAGGIEVYLPMLAVTGKRGDVYGVPMFTNFLFARLGADDRAWREVFSARGVAGVLSACDRPSPLADLVIHRIRMQEHGGYVRLLPPETSVRGIDGRKGFIYEFKAGDRVTLKKGPLAGLDAIFVSDVDGGRNSVLLRLLADSPKLVRMDPRTLI